MEVVTIIHVSAIHRQQAATVLIMNANDTSNRLAHVRLDKWLFAARFYKTRGLANKAIQQGKVAIDQQKPKASRLIGLDTIISLKTPLYEKTICVKVLGDKRQSAKVAQTWYEETSESLERQQIALAENQKQKMMFHTAPNPHGKPNKHGRKNLRELKRKEL